MLSLSLLIAALSSQQEPAPDFDVEAGRRVLQEFARLNIALDPSFEENCAHLLDPETPVKVKKSDYDVLLSASPLIAIFKTKPQTLRAIFIAATSFSGRTKTDLDPVPHLLEFAKKISPPGIEFTCENSGSNSYSLTGSLDGFSRAASYQVSIDSHSGRAVSLMGSNSDISLISQARISEEVARASALAALARIDVPGETFEFRLMDRVFMSAVGKRISDFSPQQEAWQKERKALPTLRYSLLSGGQVCATIGVCAVTGRAFFCAVRVRQEASEPQPRVTGKLFVVLNGQIPLGPSVQPVPDTTGAQLVWLDSGSHVLRGRFLPEIGVVAKIDGRDTLLPVTNDQSRRIADALAAKKPFGDGA